MGFFCMVKGTWQWFQSKLLYLSYRLPSTSISLSFANGMSQAQVVPGFLGAIKMIHYIYGVLYRFRSGFMSFNLVECLFIWWRRGWKPCKVKGDSQVYRRQNWKPGLLNFAPANQKCCWDHKVRIVRVLACRLCRSLSHLQLKGGARTSCLVDSCCFYLPSIHPLFL